jgi:hypothetical protein
LWLHFLNKYLAYFHPTKYRIAVGLGRGSRFDRLRPAGIGTLSQREDGPLVSVLMPVYNASATLEMAVRSILDQTWRRLELLLIDDCSGDGSLALAHALAKRDVRVKVLALRNNGGPYIAKNVALTQLRLLHRRCPAVVPPFPAVRKTLLRHSAWRVGQRARRC